MNSIRCFGTDGDYEREPEISVPSQLFSASIISRHVTLIISMPVLKDHDLSAYH